MGIAKSKLSTTPSSRFWIEVEKTQLKGYDTGSAHFKPQDVWIARLYEKGSEFDLYDPSRDSREAAIRAAMGAFEIPDGATLTVHDIISK